MHLIDRIHLSQIVRYGRMVFLFWDGLVSEYIMKVNVHDENENF